MATPATAAPRVLRLHLYDLLTTYYKYTSITILHYTAQVSFFIQPRDVNGNACDGGGVAWRVSVCAAGGTRAMYMYNLLLLF